MHYNHDNAIFEISQNFAAGSIALKQPVEMLKDLYNKSKSQILHVTENLQTVDVVFVYMNYQMLYNINACQLKDSPPMAG